MADNIGIATNKTILDLYNGIRSGELVLHPDFQRKLVWNNDHKERFIETIVEGLPFPEIYIASGTIDVEAGRGTTLVVDGQQRLNTIYEYISGAPNLKLTMLRPFADIDRARFFDYKVTVRDLGRLPEDTIVEIFKRINSVGYALNAVEISNALYDGPFIQSAQALVKSGLLEDFDVYSEVEFSRMRDLELFLLLMTTLETGDYFSQDKEVEACIKAFNSDYPNRERTEDDIRAAMSFLLSASLPADSFWFRKSNFFSVSAELAIWHRSGRPYCKPSQFKDGLTHLGDLIQEQRGSDDPNNVYARYYKYLYQNTSGRVARITRGKLIRALLEQLNESLASS